MPIGQTRRYTVVRAPLEELKAIGHHLGGSITDVVLAAATGGPRELLRSREEELPPPGLRALVPVTRRDASDRLTLGNLLSVLFVDLPVGEPLAHARLHNIAAATRRRKSSMPDIDEERERHERGERVLKSARRRPARSGIRQPCRPSQHLSQGVG